MQVMHDNLVKECRPFPVTWMPTRVQVPCRVQAEARPYQGRPVPRWAAGEELALYLQTNNSKQLLNAWKAHSSEKLVSSHLSFSVRPGFNQCRFEMWLKELWNILAVLFHLRCSSGGLRFGRTKCGNHALCPASKAFTGQTIVSTQQTAQEYQICAMELLNQLAVCLRQTA